MDLQLYAHIYIGIKLPMFITEKMILAAMVDKNAVYVVCTNHRSICSQYIGSMRWAWFQEIYRHKSTSVYFLMDTSEMSVNNKYS